MLNGKKKKVITVISMCAVAAISAVVFVGMAAPGGGGPSGGPKGMPEMEQASQKTVVETQSPERGSIAVTGSYVGTVEPGQQVTIYPKASGDVTEVNFKVGDTVAAGDILFKIDSTSLQYDIRQAQANLSKNQARAQLNLETAHQNLDNYTNNAEEGRNSQLLQAEANITSAEARVKSADNTLQQANVNYRTARDNCKDYENGDWEGDYSDSVKNSLRTARSQAELQVENAQLNLESAKQDLENAKASLTATETQVEEQKTSAETNLKSAQLDTNLSADSISIEKMQNNLSNYTISSPISGVVEQCNIDVYDNTSPQQAAYIISNKDQVTVSFSVAESALSNLRQGGQITLEKDNVTCKGTISEVSSMVDSMGGLYTVKSVVEKAPFELRSGSTVKLYAETQRVDNALLIPIDAVYFDNGTPYVYTFSNNTAKKVEVEVGISDSEYYEIKSGLSLSDEIIITWSASLYDSAEVYLPGTVPQADVIGAAPESGISPDAKEITAADIPPDVKSDAPATDEAASLDDHSQQESGDNSTPEKDEEEAS